MAKRITIVYGWDSKGNRSICQKKTKDTNTSCQLHAKHDTSGILKPHKEELTSDVINFIKQLEHEEVDMDDTQPISVWSYEHHEANKDNTITPEQLGDYVDDVDHDLEDAIIIRRTPNKTD